MGEWYVRHVRRAASPGAAAAWYRGVASADVTDVLSSVRVPVVVVRVLTPAERIRYLTDRLPDARTIDAHDAFVFPFGAAEEQVLHEVEALASGAPPPLAHRVLTTVLFTDIVDSAARGTEFGDSAWANLLERHHALVRRELAHYRGKRSTLPATGSSRRSTALDVPSAALRRSSRACGRSGSKCVRASTRASVKSPQARWRVSQSS
jgi:hypothetical protein